MIKKNHKYKLHVILLFILLPFSLSFAQKIETVNGAKVIHNDKPQWGNKPQVAIEFVRQIGELDADNENYMFYRPMDIIKDNDGNIYVLDAGNHRIQKFDSDGKYRASFGRKGQGPGEFLAAQRLDIDNKSILYASDYSNRRVQRFSTTGEKKGSFRMVSLFDTFCILGSGNLITQDEMFIVPKKELNNKRVLISEYTQDGRFIRGFGELQKILRVSIFNANIIQFETDEKDNVYFSFLAQNRIEKYSPEGQLIFTMDRPLKYRIDNIKGKRREDNTSIGTRISESIGVDHKRRIWIQTYIKQQIGYRRLPEYKPGEFELEIFDNDGILLGRLPFPVPAGRIRILENTLYIIDPTEEMCIFEYKIIEK